MEALNYRIENSDVFLSLGKGELINKTIESFALDNGVRNAWVNGIGAIENPEVGYYSLEEKSFQRKLFKGKYEITSILGNISIREGAPFSHTHITFSDSNYQVFGGHLFDAAITAAGEFKLQLGKEEINRKMNSEIGLPLWCLENSFG